MNAHSRAVAPFREANAELKMHRAEPPEGHHNNAPDSDISSCDDEVTPLARRDNGRGGGRRDASSGSGSGSGRGIVGSGGGRGGGQGDVAGALPRRNGRPPPRRRRRHRAAAGQRAEDLKTYDPKDIGECMAKWRAVRLGKKGRFRNGDSVHAISFSDTVFGRCLASSLLLCCRCIM